jgi:dCTP deaminase
LPSQEIRRAVEVGAIAADEAIDEEQIQPASIDLRLGAVAYRVRASFLPGAGVSVLDRIGTFAMHAMDLAGGAVLERGCVYIVPLMERLGLDGETSGAANPKSSTGRLDIFTRLIADGTTVFDQVPAGYRGPLYVEIAPRTFSVVVHKGERLNQLRLQRGEATTGSTDVSVDLENDLVGYRARRHADLIDLAKVGYYDWREFWEPVATDARATVVLNPGDFYILASREAVAVAPDQAAEMQPYDAQVGEFRVHYAGFFDPGFGFAECAGSGSRAVLEIRSFEVPFALRHGQLVGRLVYERLTALPDKLYGPAIGSSYQRQGLRLAKQFKV